MLNATIASHPVTLVLLCVFFFSLFLIRFVCLPPLNEQSLPVQPQQQQSPSNAGVSRFSLLRL